MFQSRAFQMPWTIMFNWILGIWPAELFSDGKDQSSADNNGDSHTQYPLQTPIFQTPKCECLNPVLIPPHYTVQKWNPGKGLSFPKGCSGLNIVSLLWQLSLWRTARMQERKGWCCYLFLVFSHLWKQQIPKMDWQCYPSYGTKEQRASSLFWDIKRNHFLPEGISFSQLVIKEKNSLSFYFSGNLPSSEAMIWG